MTDILKYAIPPLTGSDPRPVLTKLAETVNMLQGVSDQQQRAVRVFEFETRVAALEQRLKKAGF